MFSPPAFLFAALAVLTLVVSAFLSPYIAMPLTLSLGSVALYCVHRRRRYAALYWQICKQTMWFFYNPALLGNEWQKPHRLSPAIKSHQEALCRAQNRLDSLQDQHTCVLSKGEAETEVSHFPDVTGRILGAGIGYLKIRQFGGEETADQALKALAELKQTTAIVVDLRDNPGGQLGTAMQITSLFLESGKIATVKQRIPGDPHSPIYHTMDFNLSASAIELDGRTAETLSLSHRDSKPRLPYMAGGKQLAVLVNEASASASELMAGALKDNRAATIIGAPTYGKGTGQSVITLNRGAQLRITTMKYFTPSGLCPGDGNGSGPGITPDIEVRQSKPVGESRGADAQLQKALKHLTSMGIFHSLPEQLAPDISLVRIFSLLGK
ncbi:MAG: hypothetical protein IT342_13805 [Candidatus Melainabacteria bacterium]|nr:hypothetical protein [Candidatus Melainabacteria bacterium]